MKYKWMDYLPRSPIVGFWETLYTGIKDALCRTRVYKSMTGCWKTHSELRYLPSIFKHEERPLFPDTVDDVYLSDAYEQSDVRILRELGIKDLANIDMVVRLEHDLTHNRASYLRGQYKDEDWHTSFMVFLNHLLQYKDAKSALFKLAVIPLSTSDWVTPGSITTNPVYLPHIIDEDSIKVKIPGNIGLRMLHPTACAVSERASVYARLGISNCDPKVAIQKIFDFQKGRRFGFPRDMVAQLEILFWYGPYRAPSGTVMDIPPRMFAADSRSRWHLTSTLFFRSEKLYDAEELLENTPSDDFDDFGFLHALYMTSDVKHTLRDGRTWKQFLEICGVRSYPALVQSTASDFSLHPVLSLVARDNPNKFVANLKEHWHDSYSQENWGLVKNELQEICIPCRDSTTKPLKDTILPTEQLLSLSRTFDVQSSLPFIKLPDNAFATGGDAWAFLREFGVICEANLAFYFNVLEALTEIDKEEHDIKTMCTNVYTNIVEVSTFRDESLLQVC